jgi:GNAT superfamily N-acetyltransferase
MKISIVRQKPNQDEINKIISLVKSTQNITGYTSGEIMKCDEIFLAYNDSELAGVAINIHQSRYISEIAVLVVDPKYQGLGIGSDLFETALRLLKTKSRIVWCVSRNPAVLHLFDKSELEQTNFGNYLYQYCGII